MQWRGGDQMITRLKAIIVVSGKGSKELMPILANHEALVEISTPEEIATTWKKNKTPLVPMRDFDNYKNYTGPVLFFNTDNLQSTEQIAITNAITDFCYKNRIEPGEFKVPNTANNSSNNCFMCAIAQHPGVTTTEYNRTAKFVDMIIYETEHFVVVPGLGPLAPGYLMIMTKPHYLSLAQIPKEWYAEYYEIEKDISFILKTMYQKEVAFYEHGTGPNGAVGLKSIVHMHIHCMLDAYLDEEYRDMLSMHTTESMEHLKPISYFTYKWGPSGELWVTDDPEVYLQRQVHRQIYAERNNFAQDQFNWRKTFSDERTKENVCEIYRFLSTAEIPYSIKYRTKSFVEACDRFCN